MQKLLILGLLVFGAPLLFAQSAPPAPAAADLSTYKSADDLKAHLQDLKERMHSVSSNEEAAGLLREILGGAQAFMKRYPSDPSFLEIKLLWVQAGENMVAMKLPDAPPPEALAKGLEELAANDQVPERTRVQIRLNQISDAMSRAVEQSGNTSAAWAAVDASIIHFQKQFGPDFSLDGQTPAIVLLKEQELFALRESDDTASYQALVEKLAHDPQPQLAKLGAAEQEREKKLAALKTKPLEIAFTAVDGSKIDLAKLRGKVVLIDFWATWCGPCVEEVPNVVATYAKYHGQGFEIVGVSLDEDKSALLAFTKKNGMTWPQYFDGKRFENAISSGFGIDSIPAMWLVDKKGMLVSTNGRRDLAGQVEKLLQAP